MSDNVIIAIIVAATIIIIVVLLGPTLKRLFFKAGDFEGEVETHETTINTQPSSKTKGVNVSGNKMFGKNNKTEVDVNEGSVTDNTAVGKGNTIEVKQRNKKKK